MTLFALQKGWITGGSSNPDIAVASKRVLTDYTTGQIVFCHVRPDYDEKIHKFVKQSGFDMPQLNDQGLTEIEEEGQEDSQLEESKSV